MARQEVVIDVFIASPGELTPEREEIVAFIDEYNLAHGLENGFRLNPLMWELNTYPAFGPDPQSIINSQIGDNYDIFIGLLWRKFGTETPRAKSGTKEEFDIAYRRFTNGEPLEIMFYFKTESGDLNQLDLNQLQQVKEFKESIQDKSLYKDFYNLEEFSSLIRINIPRAVSNIINKLDIDTPKKKQVPQHSKTITEESQPPVVGYFDLVQSMEKKFEEMSNYLVTLSDKMDLFNANMTQRTKEIKDVGDVDDDVGTVIAIFDKSAADMMQLADEMSVISPLFYESTKEGFYYASELIALYSSDFAQEEEEDEYWKETIESVDELQTGLNQTRKNISSFKREISKMPRLTRKMSEAKIHLGKALESILNGVKLGERLANEVSDELRTI